MDKGTVLKAALLLGGVSIAAYVFYKMYESSKQNDAGVLDQPKQVSYDVQSIQTSKQKPKPVTRVV